MTSASTKKAGIWCLAFLLFVAHLFFRSVAHADTGASWLQIQTKSGECQISFPTTPQMIEQALNLAEGKRLLYDVYLAPFENKGVFLLLVATYPAALPPGYEMAGVESLLKGILGHHPENQLIFAERVEIGGRPGINFLVQNGVNYFRGQAVMVGNKLFLVAMEGMKESREENLFMRFVKSFRIH